MDKGAYKEALGIPQSLTRQPPLGKGAREGTESPSPAGQPPLDKGAKKRTPHQSPAGDSFPVRGEAYKEEIRQAEAETWRTRSF